MHHRPTPCEALQAKYPPAWRHHGPVGPVRARGRRARISAAGCASRRSLDDRTTRRAGGSRPDGSLGASRTDLEVASPVDSIQRRMLKEVATVPSIACSAWLSARRRRPVSSTPGADHGVAEVRDRRISNHLRGLEASISPAARQRRKPNRCRRPTAQRLALASAGACGPALDDLREMVRGADGAVASHRASSIDGRASVPGRGGPADRNGSVLRWRDR